jgi:hypothetical protein
MSKQSYLGNSVSGGRHQALPVVQDDRYDGHPAREPALVPSVWITPKLLTGRRIPTEEY